MKNEHYTDIQMTLDTLNEDIDKESEKYNYTGQKPSQLSVCLLYEQLRPKDCKQLLTTSIRYIDQQFMYEFTIFGILQEQRNNRVWQE